MGFVRKWVLNVKDCLLSDCLNTKIGTLTCSQNKRKDGGRVELSFYLMFIPEQRMFKFFHICWGQIGWR